jgi:hypothetical protein
MATNNAINNTLPSGWTMQSTAINQVLYASAANTITGLATANSGLLITSSGGVPSISTTIPAGITMPQPLIQGVTNASNATAGNVGEVIASTILNSSAVSLTNSTPKNVTSITLSAGDWDIFSNVSIFASGNLITVFASGINTTTATLPDVSMYLTNQGPASDAFGGAVPYQRANISSPTTYFLVAQANFASGTAAASGGIYARRVR